MFGLLGRWLGRKTPAQKAADAFRAGLAQGMARAKYDAAARSSESQRHWANADQLSAEQANNPQVRRILRARSRYEVANNSYARGMVRTLRNYLIGTGPRLQMQFADRAVNTQIEKAFNEWARAVKLAAKLRTMKVSKTVDGEAFAVLTTNPKLSTKVKLDLRLVEADQVTTPDLSGYTPGATDGIVFDAYGNPTEYHVLRTHPGGGRGGDEYDRIPAASVIHWFDLDRPGQVRGVPEITAALPLFAQLRRYTLAVLAAAETAADYAAVVQTNLPPDGIAADVNAMAQIPLEPRMGTVLPEGWQVGQIKAEQPTTTYGEFKREILNEIARCLNLPFNIAAGNSASYNYASGRLDQQSFYKDLDVERSEIDIDILQRIFFAWLDEALLIPGVIPGGLGSYGDWPYQWFYDGLLHVDPQKESAAQDTKLKNFTTTLAEEYAKKGQDWEVALRQAAKEIALLKELGLWNPQPGAAAAPPESDTAPEEQDAVAQAA